MKSTTEWIEILSRYPEGTQVQFIGSSIAFVDPDTGANAEEREGVGAGPMKVWAVTQHDGGCDDPDSHSGDDGVRVVELFSTEQTANQWVDARRGSWLGDTYYVRDMTVKDSLKTARRY